MNTSGDLKKLKQYIRENLNNKARIACFLGYSCTATIDQWLKRKRLPKFNRDRILKFIEEERNL